MTDYDSDPNFEVAKSMIAELEIAANTRSHELLKLSSCHIEIDDYLPDEINFDFFKMHVNPEVPITATPCGINLSFETRSEDLYGGLKKLCAKWPNDTSFIFIQTQDGPIGYTTSGERIIGDTSWYSVDVIEQFGRASGVPYDSILDGDIEAILDDFAPRSKKMRLERTRSLPLTTDSRLNVHHESTLARDEPGKELEITQELRFEVLHYQDFSTPSAEILDLPTTFPTHATHIVFHRDGSETSWSYYATYHGSVYPGELTDEFVEHARDLILPPVRLSAQVVRGIEETLN